ANLRFLPVRWRAKDAFFGGWHTLWICACWDLPEKFGEKWIQLGDLDLVVASANFHINQPFRAWRAGEDRKSTRLNSSHVAISYVYTLSLHDALPICANLRFLPVRWRAKDAFFGGWHTLWICACWDLPEKFGEKWIQLGDLDLVVASANFHINQPFRAWRAG